MSQHLGEFVVSPAGNGPVAARPRFSSGLRGGSSFPTQRSLISWEPGSFQQGCSFMLWYIRPVCALGDRMSILADRQRHRRELVPWPTFPRAESW